MSPAGKGSPGKGGKAPAGKASGKGGKGSAGRAAAPRKAASGNAAPTNRGASSRGPAALKAAPGRPARPTEPPRLRIRYASELRTTLQKDLALPNPMLVPRMEKIVINMGVGKAVAQASLLEGAVRDLSVISGQKPVVTKAKKSIAAFKLRQGNAIGCKVTLRGDRMWEFFDRLISLAIPRIRDFRGLSPKGFDGRGNYTFGVNEQLIFPEIDYDKIDAPRGMDVTIVTTARTDGEGRALLDAFGFPFRKEGAA
jgi:large subunit ribosomal protein L5